MFTEIGYSPTASPAVLVTVYTTVSVPRSPATFLGSDSGSASPKVFPVSCAVTITGLRLIVALFTLSSLPFLSLAKTILSLYAP